MKGLRKESSLQRDASRSVGPATLQQRTDPRLQSLACRQKTPPPRTRLPARASASAPSECGGCVRRLDARLQSLRKGLGDRVRWRSEHAGGGQGRLRPGTLSAMNRQYPGCVYAPMSEGQTRAQVQAQPAERKAARQNRLPAGNLAHFRVTNFCECPKYAARSQLRAINGSQPGTLM